LLGISYGMVVLTKSDLVDEEWLELVESEVEDFVEGSFLEGAPILRFSAVEEPTRDVVIAGLNSLIDEMESHRGGVSAIERPLRLPIDRVFTMRGFGTVITGTVCSGSLKNGDVVTILPGGKSAKVRGIESHNVAVKEVSVGQRAAVNLQGVDKEAIHRGEVVAHAKSLTPSRMLDIDLQLLPHVPRALESQAKCLVHVGTAQVNGTVVLLDRDELEPGDTAPVQLRLDEYVVALGLDPIVIRGFDLLSTYGKTLGGGLIRHPVPSKHRRNKESVLKGFEALRSDDLAQKAEQAALMTGFQGITSPLLRQITCCSEAESLQTVKTLRDNGRLFEYVHDGVPFFVHSEPFSKLLQRAIDTLDDYHSKYPHRAGIPREELRSRVRAEMPQRYFAVLVSALELDNQVETHGHHISKKGFAPTLNDALTALRDRVLVRFIEAGLEPPSPTEVVAELADDATATDVKEVMDLMVASGALHRVSDSLVFAAEHIEWMIEQVTEYISKNGQMTTPQLKEITGTSRKYTVPLAEYLDAMKVTIRIKDVRKLRAR
jgi:selenocysteine-specific elongation factor